MFLLIYVNGFTEINEIHRLFNICSIRTKLCWNNAIYIIKCIVSTVKWSYESLTNVLPFFFFNKIKQGFSLDGKDNELP